MKKYKKIISHYEACLEQHGDTHLGVDWPNLADAQKRYQVMLALIKPQQSKEKLLDFGCGTAHLYDYILAKKIENIEYAGLDISPKFCSVAQQKYPQNTFYCMDILENTQEMPVFDYVIMNGVFTEKRELSFEEMWTYFQKMLKKVFSFTHKGLAFNVMSKAVDWEREDLFHLPTDMLIDFLAKNISRNFVIRNDYGLYEYTVYIYR